MRSCLLFLLLLGCTAKAPEGLDTGEALEDRDGDGLAAEEGDCDDSNPAIFPGADEHCNALDDDCDGEVDEDDAVDASTWYADGDGDGHGDPGVEEVACYQPEGFVSEAGDCDDGEPLAWTGAEEVCDEVDNDCDGTVDSDDALDAPTWYADTDEDGYGDPTSTTTACDQPEGYVLNDGDCDDGEGGVHPGAAEVPYDGVDQDCSGEDLVDVDGDGEPAVEAGGADCDDADPTLIDGVTVGAEAVGYEIPTGGSVDVPAGALWDDRYLCAGLSTDTSAEAEPVVMEDASGEEIEVLATSSSGDEHVEFEAPVFVILPLEAPPPEGQPLRIYQLEDGALTLAVDQAGDPLLGAVLAGNALFETDHFSTFVVADFDLEYVDPIPLWGLTTVDDDGVEVDIAVPDGVFTTYLNSLNIVTGYGIEWEFYRQERYAEVLDELVRQIDRQDLAHLEAMFDYAADGLDLVEVADGIWGVQLSDDALRFVRENILHWSHHATLRNVAGRVTPFVDGLSVALQAGGELYVSEDVFRATVMQLIAEGIIDARIEAMDAAIDAAAAAGASVAVDSAFLAAWEEVVDQVEADFALADASLAENLVAHAEAGEVASAFTYATGAYLLTKVAVWATGSAPAGSALIIGLAWSYEDASSGNHSQARQALAATIQWWMLGEVPLQDLLDGVFDVEDSDAATDLHQTQAFLFLSRYYYQEQLDYLEGTDTNLWGEFYRALIEYLEYSIDGESTIDARRTWLTEQIAGYDANIDLVEALLSEIPGCDPMVEVDCDQDGDNDGWGLGAGTDDDEEDCDDTDPEVGGPSSWYADTDEDGYGDPDVALTACEAPEGHVGNDGDCDDGERLAWTGNPEV